MGTNIAPNPSHYHLYNPARDLANILPHLLKGMAEKLQQEGLPPFLREAFEEIETDELGRALATLGCVCQQSYDRLGKVQLPEVLVDCGWEQLDPDARAAVMALLGFYALMLYYRGVREIARIDDQPPASVDELVQIALELGHSCALRSPAKKLLRAAYNLVGRLWSSVICRFRRR